MANLKQVVYLTQADYAALLNDTHDPKQYTKNGKTIYFDPNTLYITESTVSMSELEGILPVGKGGTGVSTLASGYALIGNGTSPVTTRGIRNNTSAGALGWTSNTVDNTLVTTNTLAYWNGAYTGTTSNISKLGTITNGTWQATVIGAAYGGTGQNTLNKSANALINALDTGSSDLTANDYVITQYVGGGTTTTTYHRRPANKVINATLVKAALGTDSSTTNQWLNKKGEWSTPTAAQVGAATSGHTHNYAGSSSAGGAANSVANSLTLKINTPATVTEGTNTYTFNGSAAKTLDIKAGSNISLTTAAGAVTIANTYSYSLPTAAAGTKGGVKIGTGLTMSGEVLNHSNSVTAQSTQAVYPIKIDAQGHISAYGTAVTILSLGTSSSTAYRGDYGNTAYSHATDSSRLTTAKSSGLYKISTTAQGHIAGVTEVTSADITALVDLSSLGLSNAMHFKGITTTQMSDGLTTAAVTIDGSSYTPSAGDVVLYSDSEFVWTGSTWERLGRDSSFKTTQTAVNDPTASGNTTSFIDTISQNTNGVITATKKTIPAASDNTAGIMKLGASGGAATYGHTHTLSIADGGSSDTNQKTLAASTKYKLTAGGSTYVFTTPPNTTYANGTGITIGSGNAINHSNSVTAKTSYGSTATTASANGGTIKVTDIQYDAQGHITASTDRTITLSQTTYSGDRGISLVSGKLGHSNTAITAQTTQAIYPIKIDAYGHITSYGNAVTVPTKTSQITNDSGFLTNSTLYEANLQWGGKDFAAAYGPIDASMVNELGANRFAFLKAAGLTIEYSTNGGSTWTDYDATNSQKVGLFSTGYSFYLGKHNTQGSCTVNDMLRVTINTGAANLYTTLNKIVIYMSTSGATVQVLIERALESTPTTYTVHKDWTGISGWSGWNILNMSGLTTYGNTASSQYGRIRFTFKQTAVNTTYASASISKIQGYGGVGWTTPSTMAATGHLYSYDADQNATFPGHITPKTNNAQNLGSSSYKWANVYATTLNGSLAASNLTGTIDNARLNTASTSAAGIVQLSSATNSTSTSLAATASAVKAAYDLAASKTSLTIGTTATTAAAGNHTHGNLTNDGKITSTATIANGDKLVIVDSDTTAASKITGSSITFDGSTATKALTQKGTWETFNNYSHPTGDGNLHVPATSTTNNGKFLQAGSTAGSLSWASLPTASDSVAGITTVGASGGAAAYSHTHSYLANTNAGAADRPIYITGNAASATTYRMSGTNVTATTALAITNNLDTGNWYVNGTSGIYSQNDGVAYVEKYSDSWIHEIYGDYRTGQIAVRGKNNGTWQAWRKILDDTNWKTLIGATTTSGATKYLREDGTWQVPSYTTSLALTAITGTDDLRAIEALTGTSGFLKKTAANTWSLDTNTYLTSASTLDATKLSGTIPSGCYTNSRDPGYGQITPANNASIVTALTGNTTPVVATNYSEGIKFTGANKWIVLAGSNSSTAGSDEIKFAHHVPSSISNTGPTSAQTPGYNATFNIPVISVDEAGHVTGISTTTVKIPATDNTNNAATHTLATTTKYYVTGTTSATTSTAGDSFDTGVYVTANAGELSALKYSVHDTSSTPIEKVQLVWNSTDSTLDFIFA